MVWSPWRGARGALLESTPTQVSPASRLWFTFLKLLTLLAHFCVRRWSLLRMEYWPREYQERVSGIRELETATPHTLFLGILCDIVSLDERFWNDGVCSCRSLMTIHKSNHRPTGRWGCWYSRGCSMLSKLGAMQSVKHRLSQTTRSVDHRRRRLEKPGHTAGHVYVLVGHPSSFACKYRSEFESNLRPFVNERLNGNILQPNLPPPIGTPVSS